MLSILRQVMSHSKKRVNRITGQIALMSPERDAVVTNRLHIGIAGVLLGKRVQLYDNSYGKIRDVYQSSLKGCALVTFDGV
jgi:exopolysaccharide biosynthesis predicted pyruvyltransferase EpsI